MVPSFDDPAIVAGQGTVGLDILDQTVPLGRIVVPCGGGGLASGIALACPDAEIVIVEPEGGTTWGARSNWARSSRSTRTLRRPVRRDPDPARLADHLHPPAARRLRAIRQRRRGSAGDAPGLGTSTGCWSSLAALRACGGACRKNGRGRGNGGRQVGRQRRPGASLEHNRRRLGAPLGTGRRSRRSLAARGSLQCG